MAPVRTRAVVSVVYQGIMPREQYLTDSCIGFHGQVGVCCPFCQRAVIDGHVLMTQQGECESIGTGGDAAAAIGNDPDPLP